MNPITNSLFSLTLLILFGLSLNAQDQSKPKLNAESKQAREWSLSMLDETEKILKEYYYDPTFHGIDLKARVAAAKERIKTLQYNWQMYRVIAQLLLDLNDSHTSLILPSRSDHFDYGFGMQMFGDKCYVTWVNKELDSYQQGVRAGDQIIKIGTLAPTRQDLWKVRYVIYRLDPIKTLDLEIRKPDGTEKAVTITAKTMTDKEYLADLKVRREKFKADKGDDDPFKCREVSSEILACRLETFEVEKNDIDKMMTQALKYPKLILDLRGNGGGRVSIEEYLIGHFFDKPVKIADMVMKEKTEERSTKQTVSHKFLGELAILIDSNSASAAEITAKVLQLENRAKIYGDRSSGKVMTSIIVPYESLIGGLAAQATIYTGMSVTIGDVIMKDKSRLENVGVTPDEIIVPKQMAFVRKADAVLAYVAQKMGANLTPEAAGGFHFILPKEYYDDEEKSHD